MIRIVYLRLVLQLHLFIICNKHTCFVYCNVSLCNITFPYLLITGLQITCYQNVSTILFAGINVQENRKIVHLLNLLTPQNVDLRFTNTICKSDASSLHTEKNRVRCYFTSDTSIVTFQLKMTTAVSTFR